jgi:predicted nucleic acid-binding Zn ribbon protein
MPEYEYVCAECGECVSDDSPVAVRACPKCEAVMQRVYGSGVTHQWVGEKP